MRCVTRYAPLRASIRPAGGLCKCAGPLGRWAAGGRNTVESYLGILEDLLIATRVPVFRCRAKRAVFRSVRPSDLRCIRAFHQDCPEATALVLYRGALGRNRCTLY